MDGSRNSLYHIQHRAFRVFNKEAKKNRHTSKQLLDKAFPAVPYSENKHINVKGEKSPYDGDLSYWSERNSKLYNNDTSKALKRQSHKCGHCGLKMLSDEKVHLHHVPRLHTHEQKRKLRTSEAGCSESCTPRFNREERGIIPAFDSTRNSLLVRPRDHSQ